MICKNGRISTKYKPQSDFNYEVFINITGECNVCTCNTLETCSHFIYECSNFQPNWNLLSVYLHETFSVELEHL